MLEILYFYSCKEIDKDVDVSSRRMVLRVVAFFVEVDGFHGIFHHFHGSLHHSHRSFQYFHGIFHYFHGSFRHFHGSFTTFMEASIIPTESSTTSMVGRLNFHGSFHLLPWNHPSTSTEACTTAMEAFIFITSHLLPWKLPLLPWKLPSASMEGCVLR